MRLFNHKLPITRPFNHKPPSPHRKWDQSALKRFPWTCTWSLCGVVLLGAISAIILWQSDGKVTMDWPSRHLVLPHQATPSVLLAVSAVLSNTLLRFALLEAQPIFWWRMALRPSGTKVSDLHNYYEHGHSILESLWAGKDFNLMSLTRLITTLAVVQGPLFQQSSISVLKNDASQNITIALPVSVESLPENFTSAAESSSLGIKPTDDSDDSDMMYAFPPELSYVLKDFNSQTPITFKTKCNGTCTGTLVAAGLDMNCNRTTQKYDLNNNDNITMRTVIWTDIRFLNTTLLLRTLHKPASQPGCSGDLVFRQCTLEPAIIRYHFNIEKNVFKLQGRDRDDTIRLSSSLQKLPKRDPAQTATEFSTQISHAPCPPCPKQEIRPEEVAPEFRGFYGLALVAEKKYDSHGVIIPSKQTFAIAKNSTFLPYEYVIPDQKLHGSCRMSWADPTDDILDGLREMMFRASIASAKLSKGSQAVDVTEITQQLIYQSDFRYLFAALMVPLFAIFGTMALSYGWWELGRAVSLSPIEVAKAFDAPLLKGSGTNADIDGLLRVVGSTEVRYGAVNHDKLEISNLIEERGRCGSAYGENEVDEEGSGAPVLVMGRPGSVTTPIGDEEYE